MSKKCRSNNLYVSLTAIRMMNTIKDRITQGVRVTQEQVVFAGKVEKVINNNKSLHKHRNLRSKSKLSWHNVSMSICK